MAIGYPPAAEGLLVPDLPDSVRYETGLNNWVELSRNLPISKDPSDFPQPYLQQLTETALVVYELSKRQVEAGGGLICPDLQAMLERQIGQLYERNQWLENCGHATLSNLAAGYDQILANLAAFHASPHTCRLIAQRCEYSYRQDCRNNAERDPAISDGYLPEIICYLKVHYLQDPLAITLPQLQTEITRRAQRLPVNQYSKLYANLYNHLARLTTQRQYNFPEEACSFEQP